MIHSMFGSRSSARSHPLAVRPLVRLRARRPHRRTPAAIEQLELNAGRVDRAAHQPAERIDLANQMTLRGAADRRIARHVRDGVRRQRAEADVRAEARGGVRRLAARVAGTDRRSRRSGFIESDRTAAVYDFARVTCRRRTARRCGRAVRPARAGR